MEDLKKQYTNISDLPKGDLKPFVGDPDSLSITEREELVFRFKYNGESVELLALNFRLTPSVLARWFKESDIEPVDLSKDEELEKLERLLEKQKRINSVRLAGSILFRTSTTWEHISSAERIILELIENTAKALKAFETIDPRAISSLTKAHTTIVKQQLEIKAFIDESSCLENLTGLVSDKLESIFKEIDNLSVV